MYSMAFGALESDLNHVVKAIDKLRLRKARPNLPALTRYLYRNHKFSSNKTVHLLDILLAQNKVKEIVYKNNISFRNMLNWREPSKPCFKNLESHINSSIVVSTMLHLLNDDQSEGKEEGVEEARLQAALIEQLDGAVKLQEIRKQIHSEVEKGTILRNKDGYFVLGIRVSSSAMPKDNSDSSSDTSESADINESESTNEDSSLDTSNVDTPPKAIISVVSKSKFLCTDQMKKNAIKNLELAIENVVKNMRVLDDGDGMTERCNFRGRRKHWEISDQPVEEPVEEVSDNKKRRIIRKKTIYDPSEFELTPLVRRKRRGALGNVVRRGRGGRRPRGGRTDIRIIKEIVSTPPIPDDKSDSASTSNSVTSSPREKRCRGRPPSHINKKCCICSVAADKTSPSILSCTLCLNIAHKDCVKNNSLYRGSRKWRCEDCNEYNPVICSACELYCNKDQVMLMCDYCEEFYHSECHYPPVKHPLVDSTWRCSNCPVIGVNERVKIKIEEDEQSSSMLVDDSSMLGGDDEEISACFADKDSSPVLQTSDDNTLQASMEVKSEEPSEDQNTTPVCSESLALTIRISKCDRHKPDEPIPLVDDWTAKQVSDYFLEKFDQDVADAFLSQDIDGKLLKQISRQYVTDDLGLQFGIALKVLYYVKKIQLGTNLLHELWASS